MNAWTVVRGLTVVVLCYVEITQGAVVDPSTSQTSRFRITNQCKQTLWIQQDYLHQTTDPVIVQIPSGKSYDYTIPEAGLAATRFWPKSDCNSEGYDCKIGEAVGVPAAEKAGNQHGPYAPDINSKFEATWGCLKSIFDNNPSLCAVNPSDQSKHIDAQTWWNASAVDGYTFPYAIRVTNHNNSCVDIKTGKSQQNPGVNCRYLDVNSCPTDINLSSGGKYNKINQVDVTHVNLQWIDPKSGKPAGCFSPCSKLTTAQGSDNGSIAGGWKNILGGLNPESEQSKMYCCPTPPVTPSECIAGPGGNNIYTQSIHQTQKCDAYAYAYDDADSLSHCDSQTRFEVVFCPTSDGSSPTPPPPSPTTVQMTMVVPNGLSVVFDGASVVNNEKISVANGSVLGVKDAQNNSCTMSVNAQSQVIVGTGGLCSQLKIDNTQKTITVSTTSTSNYKVQFNYNTSVGISAYINSIPLTNAVAVNASTLSNQSTLYAYQGSKQGNCILTINQDSVQNGKGELCSRLNIINSSGKSDVYLPADIPDMGGSSNNNPAPQPTTPKYIVFGMGPNAYVDFQNDIVTNGSKIPLNSFDNSHEITLVAHEAETSASCIIGKTGDTLSIVPDTGLLCNSGLVVLSQDGGNYYVGIPNPLPVPNGQISYGLGIARGMQINANGQTVKWDSPDKTLRLAIGTNQVNIIGADGKTARNCPITVSNNNLTWPKDQKGCEGVVVNNKIIYFPYF